MCRNHAIFFCRHLPSANLILDRNIEIRVFNNVTFSSFFLGGGGEGTATCPDVINNRRAQSTVVERLYTFISYNISLHVFPVSPPPSRYFHRRIIQLCALVSGAHRFGASAL